MFSRPLVVATGILLALTPIAQPAATARESVAPTVSAAPRATPAVPLANEQFTVSGRLTGPGKRRVHLQRRQPNLTWRTVASAVTGWTGTYSFTERTTKPQIVLRIYAPAIRHDRARVSAGRVVTTTQEASSLEIEGTRTTSTATATLGTIRVGRTVQLEQLLDGWQPVATTVQGPSPTVSWPLTELSGLPRQYRVVVPGWRGAFPHTGTAITNNPAIATTGLPRITLTTAGGAPVVSKEDYLVGTFAIDDGAPAPMQIKGRGNGSWVWTKKPYRIKLDTKQPLLGMPSEKDWVLLANYVDRSLLRTSTAFAIAGQTSLGSPGWTPRTRFVDVTLNGVDLGSYQLTEQVEASAQKVVLAPGGLLLEIDTRYASNGDPGFTTAEGTPVAYKDPDAPTTEQQSAVQASLAAFETALYGEDYTDPVLGYAPYLNLNSFADWYLVNEMMKNLDADFFSSTFVSWDPAGVLTMGPAWDFDLSSGFESNATGCCVDASGWWLRGVPTVNRHSEHTTHWYTRLTTDPAFLTLLEQRWASVVRPATVAAIAALPGQQAMVATSAELDWWSWRRAGFAIPAGSIHAADQVAEKDYLTTWLNARLAWIDGELS